MRLHKTADQGISLTRIVILGIGPVWLLLAVAWFARTQMFLIHSTSTDATVISCRHVPEYTWKTTVEIETGDGQVDRYLLSTKKQYAEGEHVLLAYPSGQIEEAKIKNLTELHKENIYFALIGVILCVPWYLPSLIRRFSKDAESPIRIEPTASRLADLELEETEDIPTTRFTHTVNEFRITDPATGKAHTFSRIEDIPPHLQQEILNMRSEMKADLASAGMFTYTDANGKTCTCSSWEDIPEELRDQFKDFFS